MVQLNDPFSEMSGGGRRTSVIRVEADHPDAGVLAYDSAVDNATNDALSASGTKPFRPNQ